MVNININSNIVTSPSPAPEPDAPDYLKSLTGLIEWLNLSYADSVDTSGGLLSITGLDENNVKFKSPSADTTPVYDSEAKTITFDNSNDILRGNHPDYTDAVEVPDIATSDPGHGFTCTGIAYDSVLDCFWVGDDGRQDAADLTYQPTIVQLSRDLTTVLSVINVYDIIPGGTSVQGVTIDTTDNTLWFCMVLSNTIYHCTKAGVLIEDEIVIGSGEANGLAYDPTLDEFWVCSLAKLQRYDKAGVKQFEFTGAELGATLNLDHVFVDDDSRLLYATYQLSAGSGAAIFVYDIGLNRRYMLPAAVYRIPEILAVEGLTIVGNTLYIVNDAYFHTVAPLENQIVRYNLARTLPQLGLATEVMFGGVIKCPTTAGLDGIWANGNHSVPNGLSLAGLTAATTLRAYTIAAAGSQDVEDFTMSSMSNWSIIIVIWDVTNKLLRIFQNGTQIGSNRAVTTNGPLHLLPSVLGNFGNETTFGPLVHREHAVYKNNATDDTRQKLEGWLAWNNNDLGLVDLLPGGHPYKTTSPAP
jgi:hypothetical protein